MEVPDVKAYSFSDWSALTPAKIEVPVQWSEASLCVHHAGYMGTRGGVLMVRLGDGAEAVDTKLTIFWPLKYVKEQIRCIRIFFLRRPTPLEPHKWAGRRAINR